MSSSAQLTRTPEPPYYAVIFTSRRTDGNRGYGEMAARMAELAAQQPGYLGLDSARGADGLGITVSYWRDEASILAWKRDTEHQHQPVTEQDDGGCLCLVATEGSLVARDWFGRLVRRAAGV